jgi:hypothetical protein
MMSGPMSGFPRVSVFYRQRIQLHSGVRPIIVLFGRTTWFGFGVLYVNIYRIFGFFLSLLGQDFGTRSKLATCQAL